jgi:hypothetical protein
MRVAVGDLFRGGQPGLGVVATGVLVETLLDRGSDGDVAEAKAAIERLASAPADEGLVKREGRQSGRADGRRRRRDIWLLRLRTLLARAQGDEARYREYRDRYRDMAKTLGFEGHTDWAEAMP